MASRPELLLFLFFRCGLRQNSSKLFHLNPLLHGPVLTPS
jgi:hypothetical protein